VAEAIQVEHLTKNYGSLRAVDDISFSVTKGKIFAFLGPNGAGKSTSIKMMTTVLKADKGRIHLHGINVNKEQDAARKSFGIVFQDQSLDDELTALENLQYHAVLYHVPKELRAKRIKKALEIVDLWERRKSLVKTFSGGMKRRINLIAGILHKPKIIYLDEPTVGVDVQSRNVILEHLRNINKEGTTIIYTSHYMEEAENFCSRVAIIDKGNILTEGKPKDLIDSKPEYTDLENIFLHITGRALRDE